MIGVRKGRGNDRGCCGTAGALFGDAVERGKGQGLWRKGGCGVGAAIGRARKRVGEEYR